MSSSQDLIGRVQSQATERQDDASRQETEKGEDGVVTYSRSDYESFFNRNEDKMGAASVFLLIANRMIGTGIFEQPSTVLAGCGSLGASLLLWLLGGLIAFSGLMVHIEFGLMVPRYHDRLGGPWRCIPRSGGEKNYYFLRMAGVANPSEWSTKGTAVAVITFACVMHSIWRKGGIWLLNGLAILKILILWAIIILGYVARAGAFENVNKEDPQAWVYFEPDQSFKGRSTGFYGWAIAILGVLYAFGGYENANYVLSEIDNPTEKLAPTAISAMVFTGFTYILTIISFYLVIPVDQLFPDENGVPAKPVLRFFELLFDKNDTVQRVVSGLIALSSLGNLMTVTFVASRVKQEIAKEGIIILPFYRFWKGEYDSAWRIIAGLFTNPNGASGDVKKDKTPIPALILHWATSLILVLAPPGYMVYQLFSRLQSYMFQACFGVILGGGLLYLRYIKPRRDLRFEWVAIAEEAFNVPKFLRPIFPSIYFISTAFLVIAPFLQHGATGESKISQDNRLKWFIFPTICFSLFGGGILFWLALDVFWPAVRRKRLFRDRRATLNSENNLYWEGLQMKWLRTDVWEQDVALREHDPRLPRGGSHVQQNHSV
ncbi:hypothetical protein TWF696_002224 [Orbilia brochopaga]|uniref:Uncharacterized protein n=1 Tax=Orbilia brochopaga TaxID=3140254 RepID=A0AAV9U650_9PEZI